jgi:hypothetical protein
MFPVLAGSNPSGYNLTRSLRFRRSASAYLNRTPASAGNRKTWTWSAWFKRGSISGVEMGLFDAVASAGTDSIGFRTDETLTMYFANAGNGNLTTTQVFRDPSAWYHIVIALDTTQATASNRVKIYLNGTQITAFTTSSYPAQNLDCGWNNSVAQNLGRKTSAADYFDGYLTEINFIDGQALTPSSFGSTNALTGVWQPARYGGTYGTNGFYLPFTDNSTAAALGTDFSGNSNTWTTNNISITAGATYDSMTDVPTLTSATAANFCTLNPLAKASAQTLSDGNLTLADSGSNSKVLGTIGVTSGKWYWEIVPFASVNQMIGIALTTSPISQYPGQDANSWSWYQGNGGVKINNSTQTAYATFTNNDVIGVALDLSAGTITFYKNNTSQGVAFSSLPAGTYTPTLGYTGSMYANFGQRPFTYTPPTGFVSLNTFNLPDSTIVKGNTVMDATLYTGTGASLAVTNAAGFQPDLVWLKRRSAADDHAWYDSVRGVQKQVESNTTTAETTETTGLTAFGSTGFTVGALAQINANAATYVGWQWQAGQGTTSTNTSGSITSTVSVNASAGFSVVTYTGDRSSTPQTVGHGLGVAPAFIIFKSRNNASQWLAYHQSLGNTKAVYPNLTDAAFTTSGFFNNTSPTSSVFTINTANENNGNLYTMVAYCWTPIAGYSAFGSYTGAGSGGTFVYTGFRPKFVMYKVTDSTGSWDILDSVRDPYNAGGKYLFANLSIAEVNDSVSYPRDFYSNGFRIVNNLTGTYIYMAFAENPFKNSLAR